MHISPLTLTLTADCCRKVSHLVLRAGTSLPQWFHPLHFFFFSESKVYFHCFVIIIGLEIFQCDPGLFSHWSVRLTGIHCYKISVEMVKTLS